jgi:hypothetical protein
MSGDAASDAEAVMKKEFRGTRIFVTTAGSSESVAEGTSS